MSYRKSYSATISGSQSYSASYGASERGGTVNGTVHWSENVNIDITVDTNSFDQGVMSLKHHIDGLTGAVVATEAAQIQEKIRGANAISQSVTAGFFHLISSEITQQMAALKSRVDSLFLKLNDMKTACQRIKNAMQQDYARITDRYASIFAELDRELASRIASLDEAANAVLRNASIQLKRSYDSTLSTVPTIFAAENSRAQGLLSAGTLRSAMNNMLQSATAYLVLEKNNNKALSAMLVSGDAQNSAASSLPVAYLAAGGSTESSTNRIFLPPTPGPLSDDQNLKQRILAQFGDRKLGWRPLTSEDRAQIERFLVPRIDAIHTPLQDHDSRVRQTVLQLWNSHTPETLPF